VGGYGGIGGNGVATGTPGAAGGGGGGGISAGGASGGNGGAGEDGRKGGAEAITSLAGGRGFNVAASGGFGGGGGGGDNGGGGGGGGYGGGGGGGGYYMTQGGGGYGGGGGGSYVSPNASAPVITEGVGTGGGVVKITYTLPTHVDGVNTMAPFAWVAANSSTAIDTTLLVSIGTGSGVNQYVCRASRSDGFHPGKYFNGLCNISWGGTEFSLNSNYQLLMLTDRSMLANVTQTWTGPASTTGFSSAAPNSFTMRVCRAVLTDGVHGGKEFQGSHASPLCHIPYGGKEMLTASYEVLNLLFK
jgi:hypothetical protein